MVQHSNISKYLYKDIFHSFNKVIKAKIRLPSLSQRLKSKGGRINGSIIVERRGDYHKRIYRFIDFKRIIFPEESGLVLYSQHDPIRTANILLLCYPSGLFSYIIQPAKVIVGDFITNFSSKPTYYGDAASLAKFSSGVLVHNIQGKIARAAGSSAIVVRKDHDQALLKLKSGELRFFNLSVIASLGSVGNENLFLRNYRKAGILRHLGHRPRVRPTSMNPVDHPLGGRTRGGSQPMNKKGIVTLNRPTKKHYHNSILTTKRQLKLSKQ
jgi:large subunit ribosomal protein L2